MLASIPDVKGAAMAMDRMSHDPSAVLGTSVSVS